MPPPLLEVADFAINSLLDRRIYGELRTDHFRRDRIRWGEHPIDRLRANNDDLL
jgi:hypothetical protein